MGNRSFLQTFLHSVAASVATFYVAVWDPAASCSMAIAVTLLQMLPVLPVSSRLFFFSIIFSCSPFLSAFGSVSNCSPESCPLSTQVARVGVLRL